MFCKYCGKDINPSAFCKYCGRALDPASTDLSSASLGKPEASFDPIPTGSLPSIALCPFCKEEIRPGAVKCKHCNSDLSSDAVTPQRSARIREELRKYKTIVTMRCLECGYEGPMGLIKQIKPLHQQKWLFFLVLFGIGIPLYIFSYVFGKPLRNVVTCPSCRKTLTSQNTPTENSVFFFVRR
jgi:predicted amidophosphoribosyltransferase